MVKHLLNGLNLYRQWVVVVCLSYSLYAIIYCSMSIRSGETSSGHRWRLLCLFLSRSSLNFFFIFLYLSFHICPLLIFSSSFYICPSTFVLFATHLKIFYSSLYIFSSAFNFSPAPLHIWLSIVHRFLHACPFPWPELHYSYIKINFY